MSTEETSLQVARCSQCGTATTHTYVGFLVSPFSAQRATDGASALCAACVDRALAYCFCDDCDDRTVCSTVYAASGNTIVGCANSRAPSSLFCANCANR